MDKLKVKENKKKKSILKSKMTVAEAQATTSGDKIEADNWSSNEALDTNCKPSYDLVDALRQNLDERKILELKEAFLLFDLDGDGCISADDLRATFRTLGDDNVSDMEIEQMMNDATDPLDFDSFVMLLGYRTIELDPEDVLIEALSKWDSGQTGLISEQKIRHDLISYGDRFTEKEAAYALEEAPIANKCRTPDDPALIDYQQFCKALGGLRKVQKNAN